MRPYPHPAQSDRPISAGLMAALAAFAALHPELADPATASGRCEWAARQFATSFPGAKVFHLRGCRTEFPQRDAFYSGYANPDPALYHVVAVAEGRTIDFTRRQFEPIAAFPFIEPFAQTRRDWRVVATQWAHIDALIGIDIIRRQATTAWIAKAYPSYDTAQREAFIARQQAALDATIARVPAYLRSLIPST